jgi:hypothetical protein
MWKRARRLWRSSLTCKLSALACKCSSSGVWQRTTPPSHVSAKNMRRSPRAHTWRRPARWVLEEEIVKDIRRTGVVPDDMLAQIRGNVGALAQAQQELRRRGHRIRSADELLDATGQVLSREFGIRPTGQGDGRDYRGDRSERKRAAQQQPRAAGMRMPAEQAPRPKTANEIVQQARRARGFPRSS